MQGRMTLVKKVNQLIQGTRQQQQQLTKGRSTVQLIIQRGGNSKPNSSLAAASTMSKMSDGKKLPARSMNHTALTQGGAPQILSSSQTRDRGAKKPEMEDSNRGANTPKSVPLASIFKSPTSQEQLTTSTNSAA